ncbi:hypothetical protein AVEN_103318-1 [Araneus ventricosus]|uniref:Uncharacterized protein n=1 Tax=Araneus ventricosus TaxID=182803 RepID=A0A4Y2LZI7_ARAVE|nr:hypothetical protein AVEN_103318-1 [Araneus ventricosus]
MENVSIYLPAYDPIISISPELPRDILEHTFIFLQLREDVSPPTSVANLSDLIHSSKLSRNVPRMCCVVRIAIIFVNTYLLSFILILSSSAGR